MVDISILIVMCLAKTESDLHQYEYMYFKLIKELRVIQELNLLQSVEMPIEPCTYNIEHNIYLGL